MPSAALSRADGTGGRALSRLGLALLVSVLAGLLLAALAFPLVGAPALAAKSSADGFLELPAALTTEQPPTRTRILDADGELLATLFLENRVNVTAQQVPEHLRQAVIAIEDNRFYEHNGVDAKGTLRAVVANSTSDEVQGGSTITQQYVKNALIVAARDKAGQQAAVERSLTRKLREARYALAIERELDKDEILLRYLNIAYFGNGAYGVGAAAQYYWGKPVQDLTIAQSAMLAGMVQNPSRFDPTDKGKADDVVERRNLVLRRMADLGFISAKTLRQGRALPLGIRVKEQPNGCGHPSVGDAAFYCDYVRRELERTDVGKALGATLEERQARLLGGGLTVRTNLDRDVLEAAQEALERSVPPDDDSGARAVVDVVEPGTGQIKAMAVNQEYGEGPGQTKVNYAAGGTFGFQPGSTFKAFVLAAAVKQGIDLDLELDSPEEYTSTVFRDFARGQMYTVRNAEAGEGGRFDLREATQMSVNTYYLQLEERTGVDEPAQLAEAMGLRRVRDAAGKTNMPLERGGSFVLGVNEVSPLAMAAAYATFASSGTYCPPQAVREITDSNGQRLDVPQPRCERVLDEDVADTVNDLLQGVVSGPGPRTGRDAAIGRPVAGKTGTTNSSRAAWFVGYTPQLSSAVWVGMPDDAGAPQPMRFVRIGGRYYRQVYGGTIPADIFRRTMREALEGEPVRRFGEAPPSLDTADEDESGTVPDLRGQSLSQARQTLRDSGFVPLDGGFANADWVPTGTVAFSSPGRGDSAAPGSTVTVFRANGSSR